MQMTREGSDKKVESAKNLLVLTSTFPRWRDDKEPRFVELLCLELANYHSVTVLAPHCRGTKTHEVIESDGRVIDVYRFRYCFAGLETLAYNGGILSRIRSNPLSVLLVPFFLTGQLIKMIRLHRRFRYDVIHAHWIIPQGIVAALYRRLSRNAPALLVTSHGGDLFALRGWLLRKLKHWVLGSADQVTVVSEAMKPYCTDLGTDSEKIRVRSMGVDMTTVFKRDDSAARHQGLIFVGRLVEKKGVEYLIRAMKILMRRHPDLPLMIVGDGPDEDSLKSLSNELKLDDNITFAGSKLNSELPALLRSANIFVMPSIVAKSGDQEGLGLVAVEAMGCGCAVVATDLPAVRDTVQHGKTGLVARAADAEDLAAKIETLLDDDALRLRLAKDGNEFARERFDWSVVGADYASLISRLQVRP
jgi:glycosyltransferase involved in cell wall biosynthesis